MEKALFRLLSSLKSTTLAVIDQEGRFRVFSPSLMDQVGLDHAPHDQGELSAHHKLLSEDGVTPVPFDELPGNRALRGELVEDTLLVARDSTGMLRHQRASAAPIIDDDAAITGAVIVVRDVTAEHQLARREDDLRARMVEVINHQFRTPLTSVLGHAELLEDLDIDLPPQAQKCLARLVEASRRLAELTESVSELVDLEAASHLNATDGNIVPALESVIAKHHGPAARRGVVLTTDLPNRLTGYVDRGLVARALGALVDNAVRHSPPGGRVVVRCESDAHTIQLVVEDEGPGIPSEHRERLLEPFEVGHELSASFCTRGLGLALASTVASAHGGRLILTDHNPAGLTATLLLPRRPLSSYPPAHVSRYRPMSTPDRKSRRPAA